MVPFPKNEDFIGKSHVATWFENYRQKRMASGKPEHTVHLRLALCGLGGIGKTQDVLSFIYEYENKQPVFWIHAGSIPQFEADCRKLASLVKIPGHDDTERNAGLIVREWLESPQSGNWILVVDNADNMLDFYPGESESPASNENKTVPIAHDRIAKFIPRGPKGTVIITTRDRVVATNLASQNVIIKPELNPEQAVELFYHHYQKTEDVVDDSTTALLRLLEAVQYLPLAIVQVAAYLNLNRSMNTSQYLDIFESGKESSKRLLSKPHDNMWRNNGANAETILTTFAISFRQLQKQSKLADSFLRFMACIDRKAIPLDLLFQIHMDGVEDKNRISEALDKLVNFSVLQHTRVDFGSGKGYEIHALVHLAMQTYLQPGEMDASLKKASGVLANTLTHMKYENWAAWRVYLSHMTTLLANLKDDSEASAPYNQFDGRLEEVQKLEEKVLEVRRRTLGEEHPDTLHTMQSLAITYKQLSGRLKEAQELEEKVLEVKRRILGEEHPDTLRSMQSLAITYSQLGGRLEEVQQLEEKVLEVKRRILGEEHPDTLCSMQSLAITYSQLGGRLEDAQQLEEMIRSARRR
ncbi:P-loop containing nucleoside triphosphate hydrolase protein [Pyronema omphalodes]|nr:P-loop containing nucleoside triphosphate hydrolase protein [Pyronema omphalodes]